MVGDPSALSSALGKLFNQAGQKALQDPTELGDFLKNVLTPGKNVKLPNLDALRQPPFTPPRWRTLLVVLMRWMVDEINDPQLWLGACQPDGWVPMLTLNYTPTDKPAAVVSVGLAITDRGSTTPPLKQGIWVDVQPGITTTLQKGTLRLDLTTGPSHGSWQYDFTSGALSPPIPANPQPPTVSLTALWNPGWQLQSAMFPTPTIGTANVSVRLTTAAPMYHAEAGVGPLSVHFDPGAALGPLAAAVKVIAPSVSYRPRVIVGQGQPPSFTLGN